ncbi:cytochrome P450 family protein [Nonomuraea zeae]|uniref:Cytochrome P450 n=1 Tax=Nonomuraea zeae TaxID=1642303 RepID=A0A5S4GZL2_9ACTN|nr:cytochrome P450 [Nonomuraea zeae]TMR37874.1 cytochrome P450 [Nonomuraea zeae]
MEHGQCPYRLDPTGADIWGEIAYLRTQGPAVLVDMAGGVTGWSVTRRDVVRMLAADPRVSRDPWQHWPAWAAGEISEDWALISWIGVDHTLNAYGDKHRNVNIQTLLGPKFGRRAIEARRPHVEKLVARLLDDLAGLPSEQPVDLRKQFTTLVPAETVMDLCGVPPHLRPRARRVVHAVQKTNPAPGEAKENFAAMRACMADLIAVKRAHPGDDLTTELLRFRHEGGGLPDSELISTLILLIGAGTETVTNLLSSTVVSLLAHPDQLGLIRAGQARWRDAVDESLRMQSSFMHAPLRYAVQDIDLGDGVIIRAGDPILLCFAAAGREPALNEDADRFDITRGDRVHLSFGHGVHFCKGIDLVHLEAEIALPALFDRFPRLELAVPAGELQPIPSFIANGPAVLPVNLHGTPDRGGRR